MADEEKPERRRGADLGESNVQTLVGTKTSKDGRVMVVMERKIFLGFVTLLLALAEGGSTIVWKIIEDIFKLGTGA